MNDRLVTLAMAVYGQPEMLEVWFETLRTYTPSMLASMELLIVDDHGSPPVVIPSDIQAMLPCQQFRVLDNIAWNQPGARNLALEHVNTPLVLFVDPDMVFPMPMMASMLGHGQALERGHVIRFMLKHRSGHSKGKIDSSSPNTWFLHVDDFINVGSYDEDFSGAKGWSDVQLLDVMKSHYKIHHASLLFADFYAVEEVPDAMVTTLDRETRTNKAKRLLKVKESRMVGGWVNWAKQNRLHGKRLRFRWERVL